MRPAKRPRVHHSEGGVASFPLPDLLGPGPADRAVFVEVFAGCARLSRCAQLQGFAVLPIDGPRNIHTPETQLLTLDLTDPDTQQCLLLTLEAIKPQAMHIALPSGTGSRARERPVPKALLKNGAAAPRPLRDQHHPLGLPGLRAHEITKVDSANALANFTITLFQLAIKLNTIFSIENPANSWMWQVLQVYVDQRHEPSLTHAWNSMYQIQFSNCAHGGERPQCTLFRTNHSCFQPLALECPGISKNHEHKPYVIAKQHGSWSVDATKGSEYPKLLCHRMMSLLKVQLEKTFNLVPIAKSIGSHRQTRHHAALIPEYHHITHTMPHEAPFKQLPPQHKGESDGEEEIEEMPAFGVYHTPKQFISRALALEHPFDSKFQTEDVTRRNLFQLLTQGTHEVAKERLNFARKLAVMSKELAAEEQRFHLSLPPHAQRVLKGKRVLLFKHLLKEFKCPDLEASALLQGVDLVGVASRSPFFDVKLVPPTTTPNFCLLSSRWQRKKIEAHDIHKDDKDLAKVLWETTLQEIEAGYLQGPFHTWGDVQKQLGQKDAVCSRRFAIIQNGKPRIIDDLKESGVNKAFGAVDRLVLHDLDYITSLCHFVTSTIKRALDHKEHLVSIVLQDGEVLEGVLHAEFTRPTRWKARCVDLSKAYKQIPVSVGSKQFSVLMLHHFETGKPVYFLSNSLPFGASSAVFSFNRVSRSLWWLASTGCRTLGGVFFDDFPFVEPTQSCTLATHSVEGLLKALGWRFTDDPAKVVPFSEVVDILGARLSVDGLHGSSFTVQNKPGRLEKIDSLLSEVQEKDMVSKRQAQAIHGNLNFAMGFVLGHTLKMAARGFAWLSSDACQPRRGQVSELCKWTRGVLTLLRPKVIDPVGEMQPVLVFTDAAFEDNIATWGLVLIDPLSGVRTAIGGKVPGPLVNLWQELGSQQVITLAEAFAVLLSRIVFRECIQKRRVIFFVDNEGARLSFIKGVTPTLALLVIVQLFHSCSEHDSCMQWVERVPSSANVADLPSRNKTNEALAIINGLAWPFKCDVDAVAEMCMDFSGIPRLLIDAAQTPANDAAGLVTHVGITGEETGHV